MISFSAIVHSFSFCLQCFCDVALFVVALVSDYREGDFSCISERLQGALADAQPTAHGFVVEPRLCFGRITDELLRAVDEVGKGGTELLPRFALYDDNFHCFGWF